MSKSQKVIERLNLVQNINNPSMLKVSGEAINFAAPVDEFSRQLIAEIPNLFKFVKIMSNMGSLDDAAKASLFNDAKTYIEHLENVLDAYLKDSNCRFLGD